MRWTCFLSGRVQGVGMRFAAHRMANQCSLTGFVENLDDGRVRIVAEGETRVLAEFLETLQTYGPGAIHRIERVESPATGEFSNFTVRR
ncbi:MAG: acylphosphatase [Planctomycetota bacterium]|jgi:acylphosphatase